MGFLKRFAAKRALKAIVGAGVSFIVTNAAAFGVETPPDAVAWLQQIGTSLGAAGLIYVGVYNAPNEEE